MARKVVIVLENGDFIRQVPYVWEPNGEVKNAFVPTNDYRKAFSIKSHEDTVTMDEILEKYKNSEWAIIDTDTGEFIYD